MLDHIEEPISLVCEKKAIEYHPFRDLSMNDRLLLERLAQNERKFNSEPSDREKLNLGRPEQNHVYPENRIFNLEMKGSDFNFIRCLNLADLLIGKEAVNCLCSSEFDFKHLQVLNLSKNPLGNESVKNIADNSYWTELQMLNLQNVKIDHQGVQHLAKNKSWVDLRELDLSQNPDSETWEQLP